MVSVFILFVQCHTCPSRSNIIALSLAWISKCNLLIYILCSSFSEPDFDGFPPGVQYHSYFLNLDFDVFPVGSQCHSSSSDLEFDVSPPGSVSFLFFRTRLRCLLSRFNILLLSPAWTSMSSLQAQ